jgi:hypothetical protein
MLNKTLTTEFEDEISAKYVGPVMRGQSPRDHQHEHVPVARSTTRPRDVAVPPARRPRPGKGPGIPKHGRRDPSTVYTPLCRAACRAGIDAHTCLLWLPRSRQCPLAVALAGPSCVTSILRLATTPSQPTSGNLRLTAAQCSATRTRLLVISLLFGKVEAAQL